MNGIREREGHKPTIDHSSGRNLFGILFDLWHGRFPKISSDRGDDRPSWRTLKRIGIENGLITCVWEVLSAPTE